MCAHHGDWLDLIIFSEYHLRISSVMNFWSLELYLHDLVAIGLQSGNRLAKREGHFRFDLESALRLPVLLSTINSLPLVAQEITSK